MGVSQRTTAQQLLRLALSGCFGDLGTSPLYTEQTVFNPGDPHPVRVSTENIFGIVSLIFWSVTIIVTVTYVWLVMRADNDGEGCIVAPITLIRRRGVPGGRRAKVVLAALGIFGASLFFGDSMPWINCLLMVAVLTLVLTFRSSAALAYAFGMAVTGTITITTLLFFYVVRYQRRRPWWIVAPGAAVLLTVDLLFFAANLTKLVSGAWLPLLIAIVAFTSSPPGRKAANWSPVSGNATRVRSGRSSTSSTP